MTANLTATQAAQFREQGYLAPVPALSTRESAELLALLNEAQTRPGPARDREYYKPHLVYPWLCALVSHPAILDAVESLLGPDLFVWGSAFFIKNPGDPKVIHWHQDSVHYGLEPEEAVTAWVALADSTAENGCLRVIPGSHRAGTVNHDALDSHPGTLFRGAVARGADAARAVDLELRAGQMSLHHLCTIHGSRGNPSARRRVGYAIRYVPAHVRHVGHEDSALLVRGRDPYGHFLPEQPPLGEDDPGTRARYEEAMARREKLIFTSRAYLVPPDAAAPAAPARGAALGSNTRIR